MDPISQPGRWPDMTSAKFASRIVPLSDDLGGELAAKIPGPVPAAGRDFLGIALIGLADDEGVRLNGGRLGAARGPHAFREALSRYGINEARVLPDSILVFDAGDIRPAPTLEETHERVTNLTRRILEFGLVPVGIGGGHDLTFPLVRAVFQFLGTPLDGLYFDPHLDVRVERGSGMPFRCLVEIGAACSLRCVGYEPFANSATHEEWFLSNGGSFQYFEPWTWPISDAQFVSVDLDVIDASQAPGVSAMNPCGMSSTAIAEYAFAAGRSAQVCCFDIMELSPPNDLDGRTARVAAHLFLSFARGIGERVAAAQSSSCDVDGDQRS